MSKVLTARQVEEFSRDGYAFPFRAIDAAAAADCRARLEALAASEGGKLSRGTNHKPHLLLPWLNDLVRDPRILDAVEDVLGPDLFCWGSGFFWKPAKDPAYISWHQDATYWGLSSPDVVTAWIALTPSTVESGCMRVVPGTHREQVRHVDTFAADNLLTRGQEIAAAVDEDDAVDVVLQPGEMSLHHVLIVHGSKANRADHPRIGYAIRYVAAHVRQISGVRDSATLVRGVDRHGNFDHEPVPRIEFDPETVPYHAGVLKRSEQILYAGAEKVRPFDRPASAR